MYRFEIVIAGDERVGRGAGGHAGTGRDAEGERSRAGLHEERIRVAVVTALELDDALALCCRTRHTDGAHRRLGPGVDEPQAFDRGHQPAHTFAELDLQPARGAKARPTPGDSRNRVDLLSWRVAMNQRTPGHYVIDELVAVDILDPAAVAPRDEERSGADRFECPNRAVDAPRKELLGAGEKRSGFGDAHESPQQTQKNSVTYEGRCVT